MKSTRIQHALALFGVLTSIQFSIFSLNTEQGFAVDISNNLQIVNSSSSHHPDLLKLGSIEIPHENDSFQSLSNLYKKHNSARINAESVSNKVVAQIYEQAELLSLSTLSRKESVLVMNKLIHIISKLFDLLEYWERINNHPVIYYATHWPTKFFEKKPLASIAQESIRDIKEAIYYYTFFLGKIYRNAHIITAIKSEEEFKVYLLKTAQLINKCLSHEPFEENNSSQLPLEDLHKLLLHNHEIALHFETSALMRISKHKSPGHFERNWLRYAIGSATVIGGLIYYKTHQELVIQKSSQAAEAIKRFFNDNLSSPLKKIFDAYFSNENHPAPTEFELKTQTISQNYLIGKFPQQSLDEIKKMAEEMTLNRDSSKIKDDIDFAYNNPGKAWYYGSITAPLIEGRMEIIKAIDAVRHSLNQNRVNFELAMMIPAAAILGGLYVMYRQANKISKNLLSDRNPIREGLINIENTLNKFNKRSATVPFEAEGLILYWLSKLRCYVPHMPEHHKSQFEEDLFQISSPDFELHQKLATLDRMYRTYDFLGFGPQRKLLYSYGAQSFINSTLNPSRSHFVADGL